MHKLKMIIKGLRSQRTRSMLTGVSTLCATAIITCLIAFFYATTQQMSDEMRILQQNTKITVQLHPSDQRRAQITYRDYLHTIRPVFKGRNIAASKKSYVHVFLDDTKRFGDYYEHIACDSDYLKAHNIKMTSGRFFDAAEYPENLFVIVGHDVAKKLYTHASALGADQPSLFVGKLRHEILGEIDKQQDKFFYGQNNINRTIYTHFKSNHSNMIALDEITIQVSDPHECPRISDQLRLLLREHFPDVNYQITDMSQTAKQIQDYISKIRFVLITFGFISTLVASINITNSMYAIISERFQEIGIRLAIGATAKQVKQLLLSETLFLATVSATVGMVIGEVSNMLLIHFLDWDYTWHLFAGPASFFMMTIVCLISCYVPLLRIDKINPIHAIQRA